MSGFSASVRSRQPELMDHEADYDTLRGCLADLARVNRISLGYRPTLRFLDGLRRDGRTPDGRPLEILDVGGGYGDMAREIVAWSREAAVPVRVTSLDRNPLAARAARSATPSGAPISYVTADLFDYAHDGPLDVVVSALFTHHLDDDAVVRFLSMMERTAGLGWFVNDLSRSRLAYVGFGLAAGALRMHPFVRHDGPVSFARSFRPEDWRALLAVAGVPEGAARLSGGAPFRLCVSRVKP